MLSHSALYCHESQILQASSHSEADAGEDRNVPLLQLKVPSRELQAKCSEAGRMARVRDHELVHA